MILHPIYYLLQQIMASAVPPIKSYYHRNTDEKKEFRVTEPRFKAEDFHNKLDKHSTTYEQMADVANAKLESWLCGAVYNSNLKDWWCNVDFQGSKFTARLFGVQEIKKEPCEHRKIRLEEEPYAQCRDCCVRLKARWEVVE